MGMIFVRPHPSPPRKRGEGAPRRGHLRVRPLTRGCHCERSEAISFLFYQLACTHRFVIPAWLPVCVRAPVCSGRRTGRRNDVPVGVAVFFNTL